LLKDLQNYEVSFWQNQRDLKFICQARNQIFTVFSKAELLTTDNELIAIAAAAMIGFRKPKAAMGMAAVL
jgi:hypothetical protein